MALAVHQVEFSCSSCGQEGLIQSDGVPGWCPVCGAAGPELEYLEFVFHVEGDKRPRVKRKQKNRYVGNGRRTGPPTGQPNITHRSRYTQHVEVVGRPVPVKVEVEEYLHTSKTDRRHRYRNVVTLNCGYKGPLHIAALHMNRCHDMTLQEAREVMNIKAIRAFLGVSKPPSKHRDPRVRCVLSGALTTRWCSIEFRKAHPEVCGICGTNPANAKEAV